MTIEQTVEIPVDHKIFFEFLAPKEIPAGLARLELKITPVIEIQGKPAEKKESAGVTPRADRLLGIAAHLGDLSLEEIRAERLAKYQK
ncbi:MAG: hypothetical protein LBB89_09720 [Treponema sp.]|jgi:hypothetical protein|nr:hypothetical protein [Treponema sp.]